MISYYIRLTKNLSRLIVDNLCKNEVFKRLKSFLLPFTDFFYMDPSSMDPFEFQILKSSRIIDDEFEVLFQLRTSNVHLKASFSTYHVTMKNL